MPIRRTIKNVVKNYSDSQIKVREATSNDPWGPSTTLMAEISDLTYNVVAFTEIMRMVWKRLNDHGKNWRHVYKSLVLLDYLIKNGSEKVAQQCKENIFAVQTLCDFQYVEDNKDNGLNVRERAKQLVSLLKDEERLKNTRVKAHKARERLAQNSLGHPPPSMSSGDRYDYSERPVDVPRSQLDEARPSDLGEEEIQLQLALAISKEEHDEEVKRNEGDDMRLKIAIEQSKQDGAAPAASSGSAAAPPSSELLDLATPPPASNPSWGTTDPWGASQPPPPYPTDPWGAQAAPPQPPVEAPAQPAPKTDPWSAGSPAATPPTDPWGSSTASAAEPASDPWSSPVTDEQAASTLDWLGEDASPTNGVSKPAADPWSQPQHQQPQHQQPLIDPSNDAFDLSALDPVASVNQQRATSGSKTPEDFLGDHSRLVNLDQLVAAPAPSGTGLAFAPLPQNPGLNPFMSASTQPNPFAQTTVKPTLNQIQTQNTGFSAVGAGGLLPAPLQPSTGMGQPVASNNASNPFL